MTNFWTELKKPFFCLAPMYDVTDAAFRAMFVKYGRPDVFFTEFVSADGLVNKEGQAKLLRELHFVTDEKPIVAQIFGSQPSNIEKTAKLIKDLGFDGLDINMGCPDRAVEKQGAGAALIKNQSLAKDIILAAKQGVGDLPVSVKTRIGYQKIEIEKWASALLEAKPTTITFHLRTRKELSKVSAHWEVWPTITKIFQESNIVLVANGDIQNIKDGQFFAQKYDLDGIMVGRGALGRPWFFTGIEPTLTEKLKALVEHSKIFWDLYGPTTVNQKLFKGHTKNFAVMRKHFKAYVAGFRGATALRAKLMLANNPSEVETIIKDFIIS